MSQGYNPQDGQGYAPQGGYQQPYPQVQSPMVWSVLATILCCLPAGIVSIVYASKVNSLMAAGNYREAKTAADNAKMWAWISFGLGLVVGVISFMQGFMQGMQESGAL